MPSDRRGGTPGATPQKELVARNYKARSTRRTASPIPTSCASSARTATARSADRADARVRAAAGLESDQEVAADYITQVRAKYGKDSRTTFGGHAWDAYLLLAKAIPEALKKAKPGTRSSAGAARRAREHEGASSRPTACTRWRRRSTTGSTTARDDDQDRQRQWVLAK
jgi:branched-chain amino acid transport system substrate-binding protein